jgi:hypothetical protein
MALELIICPLDVLRNNLVEIDENMFLGVERPCELIFCMLEIQRSDLDVFD